MKFYLVRIATHEIIEAIEKEDLFEACKWANMWYGEDVDIYYADEYWKDMEE